MKKLFVICYLLFVISADAFAAVVSRVDVSGNRRMDAESVRLLADVRVGENVSTDGLNQITKKLQTAGLFSHAAATITDGGVLRIKVTEAPVIDQVTIEGNDAVSTDDLKKEIRLAPRASYEESVIGADVQRMLSVYQRQGYFGTKIVPQKIELSDGRVNVVYEITEGHPTYIRDIEFAGNEKFSARTLRSALLSREYSWWKFMASFDVYDEDRILYDQQLLRQFYLRNGYVDFRIKNTDGTFSPDRQWYSVKFTVEEGPRYEFGAVKVTNPFPDVDTKKLERAIAFRAGDTYNTDQIEATIGALRNIVADAGYAFINVDPVMDKDDATRTIAIDFQVQKTSRIYINKINILGNMRTFDSVVGHQLMTRAGDPFSLQNLEQGRQRMMRTQYYKSVDIVPTRVGDTNQMNVDVKIEEQPTGELSGGVGWSNINGFMIDAGISEKNFMGRGQYVSLRANVAQYQKNIGLSFTEPYLFDRELSGGFDVNYTMYDYGNLGSYEFNRDSFVVAGRLGWKLTDNWTQTLRLSAMFDANFDLRMDDGWQRANLYTVGTNWKYQKLDTDFAQNTHDGVIANFGVAYTGFGSTEEFMRYNADVTGLLKFFDNRWQLKSTMEFGYLQPTRDEYISRMYRYFLGGDNLRGFDIAGIGSRNWRYDNYALGGLWKVNGTTQLNFPIFIPDEYQIKGFVFTDYGILGKPPAAEGTYCTDKNDPATCGANHMDEDWRVSYGVGVYWNTPMGPMNFSWGWPLLSKSYDREQRFLLSFATQF